VWWHLSQIYPFNFISPIFFKDYCGTTSNIKCIVSFIYLTYWYIILSILLIGKFLTFHTKPRSLWLARFRMEIEGWAEIKTSLLILILFFYYEKVKYSCFFDFCIWD